MDGVDLISSSFSEIQVETFQQIVIDLPGIAAFPADQVVMRWFGGFVDQLPIAYMRYKDQALLGQKAERAIYRGFGHARDDLSSLLVNLEWRQVLGGLVYYLKDRQPLGGQAVSTSVHSFYESLIHDYLDYCN